MSADACIHNARDATGLAQDLIGHLLVTIDVRAINLNIDRRRQAEIQDLRHHVSGQEGECGRGELAR